MAADNQTALRRWIGGAVHDGSPGSLVGGSVRADRDGVLRYHRRADGRGRGFSWGPVELARCLPNGAILLNGDGFRDQSATNWQTQARNTVNGENNRREERAEGRRTVMIIPFAALDAAGIVMDSIRPIHVVPDEVEEVYHKVDFSVFHDLKGVSPAYPGGIGGRASRRLSRSRTYHLKKNGVEYTFTQTKSNGYYNRKTNKFKTHLSVTESRSIEWSWQQAPNWVNATRTLQVQATPDPNSLSFGRRTGPMWITVGYQTNDTLAQARTQRENTNRWAATTGNQTVTNGEIPDEEGYYWVDRVHHLGAVLFSAVDASGKRHKFISAFDEDEPNRMYFLAQLPDRSGANTYEEALLALAPPIVHQARLEGRKVFRQGDVFAIETKLTTDEVYALAKTRVRRRVALLSETWRSTAGSGWWEARTPAPGEVRERIECPCGCGHKGWMGCGPKAKRALSIYGTGHTATEVVVTAKGVTYIRGTMHHDPGLNEPGRNREHADVPLGDDNQVWFLAVRNTVPRRKPQQQQVVEENAETQEVAA